MDVSLDPLEQPPAEAARGIALRFLAEARAACDRLADPRDATALHDFRVALRRLRSTRQTWRGHLGKAFRKKHGRALGALQRSTGAGRDAEVALEWLAQQARELGAAEDGAGVARLVERLEQRLADARLAGRGSLEATFARVHDRLRTRLQAPGRGKVRAGRCFAEALAAKARARMRDVGRRLARVTTLADGEAMHEARIRCKRLRYLVEPVASRLKQARTVVKLTKQLQDVLGDLNDARVLRAEARGPEVGVAPEGTAPPGDAGLDALQVRLQERQRELFARLEADWLRPRARRLVDAVEALALALEQAAYAGEEIERKFLLTGRPSLPPEAAVADLEQGYLPTKKGETRVRRTRRGAELLHERTVKRGSGLRRRSTDEPVSAEVFAALWPLTEGRRVRKRRYAVPVGGRVWEIDEFLDRDLWLAEIELERPDEEVQLPPWLAAAVEREVTACGEYANRRLAR